MLSAHPGRVLRGRRSSANASTLLVAVSGSLLHHRLASPGGTGSPESPQARRGPPHRQDDCCGRRGGVDSVVDLMFMGVCLASCLKARLDGSPLNGAVTWTANPGASHCVCPLLRLSVSPQSVESGDRATDAGTRHTGIKNLFPRPCKRCNSLCFYRL